MKKFIKTIKTGNFVFDLYVEGNNKFCVLRRYDEESDGNTEITIPKGVIVNGRARFPLKTIAEDSFVGTNILQQVTIPDGDITIEECAFFDVDSIEVVYCGAGNTIKKGAFAYLDRDMQILVHSTKTKVEPGAFEMPAWVIQYTD